MVREVEGNPGEPGPGDETALRHPKSRRANPAGEPREMRLIHPHCIQKPKWKALGVTDDEYVSLSKMSWRRDRNGHTIRQEFCGVLFIRLF